MERNCEILGFNVAGYDRGSVIPESLFRQGGHDPDVLAQREHIAFTTKPVNVEIRPVAKTAINSPNPDRELQELAGTATTARLAAEGSAKQYEKENRQLQLDLAHARADYTKLANEHTTLTAQFQATGSQLTTARDASAKLQALHTDLIVERNKLKDQVAASADVSANYKTRAENLQAENDRLSSELVGVTGELDAFKASQSAVPTAPKRGRPPKVQESAPVTVPTASPSLIPDNEPVTV